MSVALDPQTQHYQPDEATLLVAHSLSKRHGEHSRLVVDGISLAVSRGEWLAVTGPSGSGKSTLLHLLGGLTTPTVGSVRLAGVDLSGRSESERARLRRRHVGYVFQRYNLIDDLAIVDDVALPLRLNGVRAREARRQAAALLHRLGLGERVAARPASIAPSGSSISIASAACTFTRSSVSCCTASSRRSALAPSASRSLIRCSMS